MWIRHYWFSTSSNRKILPGNFWTSAFFMLSAWSRIQKSVSKIVTLFYEYFINNFMKWMRQFIQVFAKPDNKDPFRILLKISFYSAKIAHWFVQNYQWIAKHEESFILNILIEPIKKMIVMKVQIPFKCQCIYVIIRIVDRHLKRNREILIKIKGTNYTIQVIVNRLEEPLSLSQFSQS